MKHRYQYILLIVFIVCIGVLTLISACIQERPYDDPVASPQYMESLSGAQALMQKYLHFSRQDLDKIEKGQMLIKVRGSKHVEHEIEVFGAMQVKTSQALFLEQARDIESFIENDAIQQIKKFSKPPRLADLQELMLDDRDLKDLKACRPEACQLKLDAGMLKRFQEEIKRKAGLQRWGQGSDPTKVLYWEALPYWMFRRYEQGYAFPTEENPMPDALTGATPDTDFRVSTCLNPEEIHVSLFLEVNMSLDFNEIYSIASQKGTKHSNKRSGQPSLIYRAEVNLERPGRYEMQLIGHAHPAGANGQLFSDLSGVTTALQMIEQAVIVVGVVAEVEKKG